MRTYLVTGGLGFLGSQLARALVLAGQRVRVLDDGSRGSAARLGDARESIELIEGDVRDAALVQQAMCGVDSVCHLAFVNGTEVFYRRPAHVLDVGVKGMVNVIEACIRADVGEMILASSSEVYQTPHRVPTDEAVPLSIPDPHNPRYSYAGGKIISELLALHYGRDHFRRVLIFRPHNVFGPDMGWDHVIPQLTARLVLLKAASPGDVIPLPIQGTGRQSRAFIYIEDFIAGLMRIIERGEHLNIYNIGTMEELTIEEVAYRIARCLDMQIRVVPGPEPAGATPRRCPDIHKLQALGFRPRFSFDEGLPPTVAWYSAHAAEATAVGLGMPGWRE